jgi:hypothetical protein
MLCANSLSSLVMFEVCCGGQIPKIGFERFVVFLKIKKIEQ